MNIERKTSPTRDTKVEGKSPFLKPLLVIATVALVLDLTTLKILRKNKPKKIENNL